MKPKVNVGRMNVKAGKEGWGGWGNVSLKGPYFARQVSKGNFISLPYLQVQEALYLAP